jgi:tetratricopeptide (TPR) repeat protein
MESTGAPLGQTTTSKSKADELRKSGKFDAAAAEYGRNWPSSDKWAGWGYAFCLRKLGRTEDAFDVITAVLKLDPAFRFGRSLCSWIVWDSIRQQTTNDEISRRAKWVIRLSKDVEDPYSTMTPFVRAVLRAARAWSDAGRYRNTLSWLEQLDPTRLNNDEGSFTDSKGKTRRIGSAREKYYALRTRALEKLGRWTECLEVAREALVCCSPLHHDNDIWFARRAALACAHCGEAQSAIKELEALVARKPAFFLHTDIARIALAVDDLDLAKRHVLAALTSRSELAYKLPALKIMAGILAKTDRTADARDHVELAISIRSASEWGPDAELARLASDLGAQSDRAVQDVLPSLLERWATWSGDQNPRQEGTIERLLPHGRAGFIHAPGGNRHYFDIRDWKGRDRKPTEGLSVTFSTASGFDKKRQRATMVARDIKPTDEAREHVLPVSSRKPLRVPRAG